MGYSLGIHVGHDASCAIVHEGRLIAAVQQERISRYKHDGAEGLSNRLPVNACLSAAGITLSDVDCIVSSFQTVAPGGFGLHRPLIYPNFNLFNPWDGRHTVISHHLAHAYCAFYSSGFSEAAVMICDLGGSSTINGKDFYLPFNTWYGELTGMHEASTVVTECFSLYDASSDSMILRDRDFCIPHSVPESFVQNLGSLYDNVSRSIFGSENAHGQLMALAALADDTDKDKYKFSASDIIEITPESRIIFRNDWQHKVEWKATFKDNANLARACQTATENALLAYTQRARHASSSFNLTAAGGVFLNILANTKIAESNLFDKYYVPSAPNDAGISVGCAFFGDARLKEKHSFQRHAVYDRLGQLYEPKLIEEELLQHEHIIHYSKAPHAEVVSMLAEGAIIARWSGRAEFGPRALGGRSLLGSPLLSSTKNRMNTIKGRQQWRPVAPIVPQENFSEFFSGPVNSPYMTFAHQIHAEHAKSLSALHHPDNSTRVQTLRREEDSILHQMLLEFGSLTGYPILVNTSMNGAGEPIIETPKEALKFFITNDDIDALLIDSWLVTRREPWQHEELMQRKVRLADGCLVTLIFPKGVKTGLISLGGMSFEISEAALEAVCSLGKGRIIHDVLTNLDSSEISEELYGFLIRGVITLVKE